MFLKLNKFPSVILYFTIYITLCQAYFVDKNGSKNGFGNDCQESYYDETNTKFIDLTHAFNNNTAVWPGRKITFFKEWERRDSNGIWSASYGWCTSEHSSTHMDAPYHFNEFGRRLNEIPWYDLIDVPGCMIDIYDKVHEYKNGQLIVNDNYALTVEDILEWEEKNGLIPQKAVVLLRTGWDSRWSDPRRFRGEKFNNTVGNLNSMSTASIVATNGNGNMEDKSGDENNDNEVSGKTVMAELKPQSQNSQFYDPSEEWLTRNLSFPGYGAAAAEFLSKERSIRGAGIDTISIDPGNQNVLSPAHQVFTSKNIYLLEMVANLHELPPQGFKLWMIPFKIDRGTGAPTRVIAKLCDEY